MALENSGMMQFCSISKMLLSDAEHFAALPPPFPQQPNGCIYSHVSLHSSRGQFLVCNQEFRDNLPVSLEEFWVNVLAPYLSLLCPPTEQFIFMGLVSLQT